MVARRTDEDQVAADEPAGRLLGLLRIGAGGDREPFGDRLRQGAGEEGGERTRRPGQTGERSGPYALAGAEAAVRGERGARDQQPASGEPGVVEGAGAEGDSGRAGAPGAR